MNGTANRRLLELTAAVLIGWFMCYLFTLYSTPSLSVHPKTDDVIGNTLPAPLAEREEDQEKQEIDEEKFMELMEQRQKERKELLRGFCAAKKMKTCLPDYQYQGRSLYSKNFKYTICRIQKVASSNWLRAVLVMDDLFSFDDLHNNMIKGDAVIAMADKMRAVKSLGDTTKMRQLWEDSLNIITVRHPFLRVVSAFHDKMSPNQNSPVYQALAHKIESTYRHLRHRHEDKTVALTGYPTFEDFVNFLTFNPRFERFEDEHWAGYYYRCLPCTARYDAVVKMETIDDDMRYLRHKLNVTGPYREVFLKPGRFFQHAEYDLFTQLPPELIHKLYKRYYADFTLFGYSWPSWLPCPT